MKKDLIIVGIVVVLIVCLAFGVKIQSVEDYYATHLDEIKEDSKTVTVSISCATILDNYDKLDENLKNEKYVPADGIILAQAKYVLRKNDTVFDMLKRITAYYKIPMVSKGDYIEGINNIFERSCGAQSGWMFKINGNKPSTSCKIKLNDGDKVEWLYTCELGNDI